MLAPICLFTYNRFNETKQTIEALRKNSLASSSDLFIFSDSPKTEVDFLNVMKVRDLIRSTDGFKSVQFLESNVNKGLANSIIDGVTLILKTYDKVIVLEDDLVSSPRFLEFMNRALDFYDQDKNIQSINGYSLSLKDKSRPIYFQVRPFPWGWATWSDRWDEEIFNKKKILSYIDANKSILTQFRKICGSDISRMLLKSLNNKNDSWYVRWSFDHFRNNTYSVYPTYSYIKNIGFNNHAINCKGIKSYKSEFVDKNDALPDLINYQKPNKKLTKSFLNYFTYSHKLMVRIMLLPTKRGRQKLIEDFKIKIGLI